MRVTDRHALFRLNDEGAVRTVHHLSIEMLESCCHDVARILREAESDAFACLNFPASHWRRLYTNDVQERDSREKKRRLRMVQVYPSAASLERLADAVMCDRNEARLDARYFSEKVMTEHPRRGLYTNISDTTASAKSRRRESLSTMPNPAEIIL